MNNRPAIVLFNPDIPQNTGNIIRLCANCGFELHLIKPLGWGNMDDKKLLRSGLDYHEFVNVKIHESWHEFVVQNNRRLWAVETSGTKFYTAVQYNINDAMVFGSETKGLPDNVLDYIGPTQVLRIPMLANQRSLNLSNSVALTSYEIWRQLSFVAGI